MYTLKVEKMSCGGCAARVTRTVQALDPNAKVEVLLKERLVRVESAQAPASVAEAITTAGYPASQVAEA
jgi:copper chaperone